MPKYTLVHVAAPVGGRPAPFRIEKVEAVSARAAIAPFQGRRLTAAEIATLPKAKR